MTHLIEKPKDFQLMTEDTYIYESTSLLIIYMNVLIKDVYIEALSYDSSKYFVPFLLARNSSKILYVKKYKEQEICVYLKKCPWHFSSDILVNPEEFERVRVLYLKNHEPDHFDFSILNCYNPVSWAIEYDDCISTKTKEREQQWMSSI